MDRRARLADQDWAEVSKKLTLFAWKAMRMKSLDDAREIAQDAIADEFENPTWDPEVFTLARHLGTRVVGLAKNSWRRQRTRNRFEVEMDSLAVAEMASGMDHPDADDWGRRFVAKLSDELRGDALARNVLALMIEGTNVPTEQARQLHVSRAEVERALERMRYGAGKVSAALSLEIEREDDEAATRARAASDAALPRDDDSNGRPASSAEGAMERTNTKEAAQ